MALEKCELCGGSGQVIVCANCDSIMQPAERCCNAPKPGGREECPDCEGAGECDPDDFEEDEDEEEEEEGEAATTEEEIDDDEDEDLEDEDLDDDDDD